MAKLKGRIKTEENKELSKHAVCSLHAEGIAFNPTASQACAPTAGTRAAPAHPPPRPPRDQDGLEFEVLFAFKPRDHTHGLRQFIYYSGQGISLFP